MERFAFAVEVKTGQMNTYRRCLGEIWEELTALLDRRGIRNFSIWNCESYIFGYYERTGGGACPAEDTIVIRRLTEKMQDTFRWISVPGQNMRLMYHDYGVIRENKEMIRHRVFMTKLKPGCEEEYKRRHDALIAARGNTVNPGPDSNFSIWCANGFIFGYNEIDTAMESEATEAEKAATIAWETRQLGIMDWITNDVDWMTGEHHSSIIRLAWHSGR